jgi:hypothetical protein
MNLAYHHSNSVLSTSRTPCPRSSRAALHSRPMLDTDSALLDIPAAPVLAAAFAFPRTPLLVMPQA